MHPYLAALERLKNCVDYWRDSKELLCEWFTPASGVCLSSTRAFNESDDWPGESIMFNEWVDRAIAGWPEKTGSESYPVDGYNIYQREVLNNTIWYNEKRLRLLDYLIEKAKELE